MTQALLLVDIQNDYFLNCIRKAVRSRRRMV